MENNYTIKINFKSGHSETAEFTKFELDKNNGYLTLESAQPEIFDKIPNRMIYIDISTIESVWQIK